MHASPVLPAPGSRADFLFCFSLVRSTTSSLCGGVAMELGPTLTEFYAPTTSSDRKQQLEQALHAFRTQPNSHLTSLEIIVATVSAWSSIRVLAAA